MPSGWLELALNAVAPVLHCATILWRMRARFLSDTFGGSRAGEYQASVGVLRGSISCRTGRIEADLEDFGSREEKGEKGDLEQGKGEQSRSVWVRHPFLSSCAVAEASGGSGNAHIQ